MNAFFKTLSALLLLLTMCGTFSYACTEYYTDGIPEALRAFDQSRQTKTMLLSKMFPEAVRVETKEAVKEEAVAAESNQLAAPAPVLITAKKDDDNKDDGEEEDGDNDNGKEKSKEKVKVEKEFHFKLDGDSDPFDKILDKAAVNSPLGMFSLNADFLKNLLSELNVEVEFSLENIEYKFKLGEVKVKFNVGASLEGSDD